eukprot:11209820-Lingulodinium_polyedra.AAC.1
MDCFKVYKEVTNYQLTPEQFQGAVGTRSVHQWKGNEVNSRLIVQGYKQKADKEDADASTPLLFALKTM